MRRKRHKLYTYQPKQFVKSWCGGCGRATKFEPQQVGRRETCPYCHAPMRVGEITGPPGQVPLNLTDAAFALWTGVVLTMLAVSGGLFVPVGGLLFSPWLCLVAAVVGGILEGLCLWLVRKATAGQDPQPGSSGSLASLVAVPAGLCLAVCAFSAAVLVWNLFVVL